MGMLVQNDELVGGGVVNTSDKVVDKVTGKTVKQDIDTLKASLNTLTSELTNLGNITVTRSFIKRTANMVQVYLYGTAKAQINTWVSLGTVPSGLKPDGIIYAPCTVNNGHAQCGINENGQIIVTSTAIGANQSFLINMTYVIG